MQQPPKITSPATIAALEKVPHAARRMCVSVCTCYREIKAGRLRIPTQTGQPFRRNLDTDSEANWTAIPTESGQPKVIT